MHICLDSSRGLGFPTHRGNNAPIMDPGKRTAPIVKDSADNAAECVEELACCNIVRDVLTPTLDSRFVDELDVCRAAVQLLTFVQ